MSGEQSPDPGSRSSQSPVPPAPTIEKVRWHSAAWWTGVGGLTGVVSLVVTLIVLLVPNSGSSSSESTPPTSLSSSATPIHSTYSSKAPPPFLVQAEDDPAKLLVNPVLSVPANVTLPDLYDGDCSTKLYKWMSTNSEAIQEDSIIRVTITGESTDPVVIHDVTPIIIERTNPPHGWRAIGCQEGGEIDAITADIQLSDPPKVDYSDAKQNQIKRLDFSISKGEAAVFYISVFNDNGTNLVKWQATIDATIGSAEQTFNINDLAFGGKDFETSTSCGLHLFDQDGPNHWTDGGIDKC